MLNYVDFPVVNTELLVTTNLGSLKVKPPGELPAGTNLAIVPGMAWSDFLIAKDSAVRGVQFSTPGCNTNSNKWHAWFGLSTISPTLDATQPSSGDPGFGLLFDCKGLVAIAELPDTSGSWYFAWLSTPYTPGDLFEISINSEGKVEYRKGADLLYQSQAVPSTVSTFQMVFQAAFYNQGGVLNNAQWLGTVTTTSTSTTSTATTATTAFGSSTLVPCKEDDDSRGPSRLYQQEGDQLVSGRLITGPAAVLGGAAMFVMVTGFAVLALRRRYTQGQGLVGYDDLSEIQVAPASNP